MVNCPIKRPQWRKNIARNVMIIGSVSSLLNWLVGCTYLAMQWGVWSQVAGLLQFILQNEVHNGNRAGYRVLLSMVLDILVVEL